jgi:hypothetical protein
MNAAIQPNNQTGPANSSTGARQLDAQLIAAEAPR